MAVERYTAVLDACVLYPAPVRDLLLSMAHVGLYHPRWSEDIEAEWVRNVLANRSDLTSAQLARTCALMAAAVPDCLVENYRPMIDSLALPDPDDRHVLAAAIVGRADAIVTSNLRDFPQQEMRRHNLVAIHPDDFIADQLELRPLEALSAVKAMRERLKNPLLSCDEFIGTIERIGLLQTATALRHAESLI